MSSDNKGYKKTLTEKQIQDKMDKVKWEVFKDDINYCLFHTVVPFIAACFLAVVFVSGLFGLIGMIK